MNARAVAFLVPLVAVQAIPSWAATAVGNFQVQLQIQASCAVTSATDMNFGSTTALSASIDATSMISVTCTNTTPYNIGLSEGLYGPNVTSRRMNGSSGLLTYGLFRDAGRTMIWGVTQGADTHAAIGNGSAQSFTVYGRVPAQSTPVPALYADTVTVTVTY